MCVSRGHENSEDKPNSAGVSDFERGGNLGRGSDGDGGRAHSLLGRQEQTHAERSGQIPQGAALDFR